MFKKLMKYELRKGIIPYVIILISLVVAFAIIAVQCSFIDFDAFNNSGNENQIVALMLSIFLVVGMAYILIAVGGVFNFVQGIMYLADEFFREKGYLTLSTPNSSYKIVASKLLAYFIRNFIYFMVILVSVSGILAILFRENDEFFMVMEFLVKNPLLMFLVLLYIFMSQLIHMVFIYLIMTLNVTVIDFKHKILSSFLMYFGITIFLRIIYFFFQLYLQFNADRIANIGTLLFYKAISMNVPIYIPEYGGGYFEMIPIPVIPIFIIFLGIFFVFYFTVCKLIDKGVNI
ncbi:hypothetical protein [Sebaldella sp. S0638]|uniref:hypothetical protein n=1 Tax=Sebaldella sp. S0638 TaxID=2957809 RepID=UPI0020A1F6D8|nr:hypothetical protein [Sebaldella sp. S0638]MCP1225185.1 hypothetical protein [Sebaldella sp. S0638]